MSLQHSTVRDIIDQVRAHLSKKGLGEWTWLVGNLAGRFVSSRLNDGTGKGLQHLLSSAASVVDWVQRDSGSRGATNKPRRKQ